MLQYCTNYSCAAGSNNYDTFSEKLNLCNIPSHRNVLSLNCAYDLVEGIVSTTVVHLVIIQCMTYFMHNVIGV